MRLKEIVTADFRKSEATMFEEHEKKHKNGGLRKDEVICFVNTQRSQLVFVHPPKDTGMTAQGTQRRIFHSERVRITHGSWDPRKLADYADEAGIELDGLKRYEQYLDELLEK